MRPCSFPNRAYLRTYYSISKKCDIRWGGARGLMNPLKLMWYSVVAGLPSTDAYPSGNKLRVRLDYFTLGAWLSFGNIVETCSTRYPNPNPVSGSFGELSNEATVKLLKCVGYQPFCRRLTKPDTLFRGTILNRTNYF